MYDVYLVTGATGFLGSTVVDQLAEKGARVIALVMRDDPAKERLPEGTEIAYGDVTDRKTLGEVFASLGENACVIHCAGIVSILSKPGPELYRVNIDGTKNIVQMCRAHHVKKLVYVSSVHAIPEKPCGRVMREIRRFSPELVEGGYAKSKAAATEYVLENAGEELNASVVQPTGIIGPRDYGISNISRTIISYCRGRLPAGVKGGYDFVDVRDVAAGVISCAEKGRTGECYILSSEYMTIKQMLQTLQRVSDGKKVRMFIPSGLAKVVSPAVEKISLKLKKKPFFTPYSISVLGANGRFSHEKASKELGYSPRKLSRTLGDTYFWLKSIGYC